MSLDSPDRRQKPAKSDRDLYKSARIQEFIARERRHDERTRLAMIQRQKKAWTWTVLCCVLLNGFFFTLGLVGLYLK